MGAPAPVKVQAAPRPAVARVVPVSQPLVLAPPPPPPPPPKKEVEMIRGDKRSVETLGVEKSEKN
jgi:hypothetical protein